MGERELRGTATYPTSEVPRNLHPEAPRLRGTPRNLEEPEEPRNPREAYTLPMRGFIANANYEELAVLRGIVPPVDEINFWRAGTETGFRALQPGEPIFFRLKSPRNAIGGFGFFALYSTLPLSMAWEVYGVANGAASFSAMRERLLRLRNRFDMATDRRTDFWIGCILVNQPVFFAEDEWVRIPEDWDENTGQGRAYDLSSGEGERVWLDCLARRPWGSAEPHASDDVVRDGPVASGVQPMLLRPRLGPRSFRVAVLDAYGRCCSVTDERAIPALEAAHVREYDDLQSYAVNNGILFRADIQKLFTAGYVTVTPELRFEVSRRLEEEFENGADYRRLHGSEIRAPEHLAHRPNAEALWWHNEERYLG
jgi:putative restriction endonuclease